MDASDVRVLSRRELNRALLARQHLLERARAPLPRVLERIGGIQAQYAPSMYVGLWSRVEGLARDDLTRALERRSVVQATLMRATIHLVSARDYRPLATALRRGRLDWWSRATPDPPAPEDIEAAAKELRRFLAGGPRRQAEIDELLGKRAARAALMWLDVVRVPPSGTWERRRADLYAAAEDWLGPAEDVRVDDAREQLVRRYLAGFGPASKADVASFTSLTAKELAPVLDRLTLRRFRSETGEELLDLPRAPLPDPDTPAPPRFLPTWDATLLVHARRTGLLPEEHRARLFSTKTPHSSSSFLVDGSVAGTWRYEGGRVRLEPFGRLPREARRGLEDEAGRLAAFHA